MYKDEEASRVQVYGNKVCVEILDPNPLKNCIAIWQALVRRSFHQNSIFTRLFYFLFTYSKCWVIYYSWCSFFYSPKNKASADSVSVVAVRDFGYGLLE